MVNSIPKLMKYFKIVCGYLKQNNDVWSVKFFAINHFPLLSSHLRLKFLCVFKKSTYSLLNFVEVLLQWKFIKLKLITV